MKKWTQDELAELHEDWWRTGGKAGQCAELHACSINDVLEAMGVKPAHELHIKGITVERRRPNDCRRYFTLRQDGAVMEVACKATAIHKNTALALENRVKASGLCWRDYMDLCEQQNKEETAMVDIQNALPPMCYAVGHYCSHEPVRIYRGDSTLYGVRGAILVEQANKALGVDNRQSAAMLGGALHGWDSPAADPANYDDEGCFVGPEMEDEYGN